MKQIHIPNITPTAKIMIIVMASALVLQTILGFADLSLIRFFGLVPSSFFGGHIYQILTFVLVPQNIFNAFFGGLIIWFFGSELEGMWGRYRFLQFFVTSILCQAFLFLIVSFLFFKGSMLYHYPLAGPSGFASALCVAYGILFPERAMFFLFFNIKGKWFAVLIVAMSLFQGLGSQSGVQAWGQIGAMLGGLAWMIGVSQASLKGLFTGMISSNKSSVEHRKRPKKSHLRIVDEEDSNGEKKETTYH